MLQALKLELINNNLANVNTPGFKRQFLVSEERAFDQTLASMLPLGDPFAKADHDRDPEVITTETRTDFSAGPIRETGNPLDVALRHPLDFFVVQNESGTFYTRAGNFTLNVEGQLVTPDGAQVQGDGGALTASGANVHIAADGSLMADGRPVGRLQVVRFSDPKSLRRVEGTRFLLSEGGPTPEQVPADLAPRSLEMPNVSVISSMAEMITANRGFEAYTKVARTIDELNGIAIQQVGRPVRF